VETAGEQYTPNDVIALIAEIIASKLEESDTLLKIYDCTCGGGNLLFGVEDRINQKFKRLTQTYGQEWNDALYSLAKYVEDSHLPIRGTGKLFQKQCTCPLFFNALQMGIGL